MTKHELAGSAKFDPSVAMLRTRRNGDAKPAVCWFPVLAILPIMVAGTTKASGLSEVGGVDVTVLSIAFLLTVSFAKLAWRRRYTAREMLPVLGFAIIVLCGVVGAQEGNYQRQKTLVFFFVTGVVIACIPVLLRDLTDLRGLIVAWLFAGTSVGFLVVFIGGAVDLEGRAGVGQATLGPAYLAAAALVVASAATGEKLIPSIIGISLIAFNGIVLITIGSRGPLVGAVAGLLVWVLLKGLSKLRAMLIMAGFGAALYAGSQIASSAATVRLLDLEDAARSDLWARASEPFLRSPVIGIGWGNYVTVAWAEYPHNAFIEVAVELGLIGLAAFMLLVLQVAIRLWRHRDVPEIRVVAALTALNLVGQQFSSDLTNRIFWIAMVTALLVPAMARPSAGTTRHLLCRSDTKAAPSSDATVGKRREPKSLESWAAQGEQMVSWLKEGRPPSRLVPSSGEVGRRARPEQGPAQEFGLSTTTTKFTSDGESWSSPDTDPRLLLPAAKSFSACTGTFSRPREEGA